LINPINGYQKDLLIILKNLKNEDIWFILAGDLNEHDEDGGTLKF
jgi:hypothetical protein